MIDKICLTYSLERTVIIGNSLGGWMALKFATAYPERVSRLVLLASAGLAPIRPRFLLEAERPGLSKMQRDMEYIW